MNVLVIGQGGREHAIVQSLKKSPKVDHIYCAPGNGGIEKDAVCLPIKESDFQSLADAALEFNIELTIVGPENPLLDGVVDFFSKKGLSVIGPTMGAAKIEGSKSYAKELMKKYHVSTGEYEVFESKEPALRYLEEKGAPIVIKADGLAAGKGVTVAFTLEEAKAAVQDIMGDKIFGEAGNKVVIEEYLEGEELTVMAFVDGKTVLPMEPAQDHKPVFDHDKGPNTGGMGSYSPVPHMSKELTNKAYQDILLPIVEGMYKEGIPFTGVLYAGLIITESGPKVIEFNARFGDPETQVILPRLKTDLIDIFAAMLTQELDQVTLEWEDQSAVCVIMSSGGYPKEYEKGIPITVKALPDDAQIFFAGSKKEKDDLVTSGGRVLGVTVLGEDIKTAREKVYQAITQIEFEGAHYRTDIAMKALR